MEDHKYMLDLIDGGHARTVKWMGRFIVLLLLVLALTIILCVEIVRRNNQAWLDYLSQYDYVSESYEQDGAGLNIIGDRNGVMNYNGPDIQADEPHS